MFPGKESRAGTMLEAKIIKTGRGPEIAGTRITVYDVLEYYQAGWHRDMIAVTLTLSSHQVEAAIRYIEEHRDEVMASYDKNMERIRRGNPPELQARLDAAHERLQSRLRELREARNREGQDAGHSGGH
jgi:uncharacterized protein (DUF433 family)